MKGKVEYKIVGSRELAVAVLAKMNSYQKECKKKPESKNSQRHLKRLDVLDSLR